MASKRPREGDDTGEDLCEVEGRANIPDPYFLVHQNSSLRLHLLDLRRNVNEVEARSHRMKALSESSNMIYNEVILRWKDLHGFVDTIMKQCGWDCSLDSILPFGEDMHTTEEKEIEEKEGDKKKHMIYTPIHELLLASYDYSVANLGVSPLCPRVPLVFEHMILSSDKFKKEEPSLTIDKLTDQLLSERLDSDVRIF
jgi:hypothetical protein